MDTTLKQVNQSHPVGLIQAHHGENQGPVACILACKTSSCYGFNYTKVLILEQKKINSYINLNIR